MDEEQEVYVIPTRDDGDYEETICAIVPLEEGLAILDREDDTQTERSASPD